jgi:serine/threonine-protein kinase
VTLEPGDILREKFRLDAPIGRGGMGQVFAATDLRSEAGVAIKVVSRALVDDVLMLRLHREAEAAQRIRSDYVPRVFEVSETEEGETFLVMERLVGEPLSRRIKDNGALPWSEVRRIGEDILRGLIDAHTAGIVHRDLKPSNVFLARKDGGIRAMVLDFGVCKIDARVDERLTTTGESIGTVAYMAPEQIRGAARVDERADLYAFGALVFEMLSGRLPHEGAGQMAILASKLESAAARLGDCARVAIPGGLDELVTRALQRDPDDRFGNAQELLKAWRALAKIERASVPFAPGAPRDSAHDEDPLASAEPPTEIAVASSTSAASGPPSTERDLEAATPADASAARAPLRGEPRMTQTSLTTHTMAAPRSGGTRMAVLLAAVGLVAGIGVAFVSFALGPGRARGGGGASRASAAVAPAPPPVAPAASSAASLTASDVEGFELPWEPTGPVAPPGPSASASAARPRPPAVRPSPKTGAPHITTHPRY